MYAALITSEPAALGVKPTAQLEVVELIATRLHGFGVPTVPAAVVLNRTEPAGAPPVPAPVSLTNAVHEEAWLTPTEPGLQVTIAAVGRRFTVIILDIPELPA